MERQAAAPVAHPQSREPIGVAHVSDIVGRCVSIWAVLVALLAGVGAGCGDSTEPTMEASVGSSGTAATTAAATGESGPLGSSGGGDAGTVGADSTDEPAPVTDSGTSSGGAPLDPTCTPCPGEPCTRECLPPISEGPVVPPPYSGARCPTLVANGRNDDFGFNARDFLLRVPTQTNGPYPVVFAWHGAGGDAGSFADVFGTHHEDAGYILVVPDGQGLYDSEWQVEQTPGVAGRPPQDDLRFFDDVLRCLYEQFPIDLRRVHTTGFSVGARFSAYLMGTRSDAVGSFAAWSGGNVTPQGITVVPPPSHPIPGLLYHGGPGDAPACCGFDATASLIDAMVEAGQFAVECDHGGGHSIPGDSLPRLVDFFLAHPFSAGNAAAWRDEGLPVELDGCVSHG